MNEQPTHLDLFSGIAGFAIAAKWAGFKTVGFCEIDGYCQAIIKERFGAVMADAQGERASTDQCWIRSGIEGANRGEGADRPRIFSDIRTLNGRQYAGVDLLTGGFPCQPFSVAGKRAGAADNRFLWPEMLRVIAEARPNFIVGENVAGIINMELDRCLSDLEGIGYTCQPIVIPACAVDAKHRRDRVWIVGHANGSTLRDKSKPEPGRGGAAESIRPGQAPANAESVRSQQAADGRQPGQPMSELGGEAMANAISQGLEERQEQSARKEQPAIERGCNHLSNPNSQPQGRPTEPRQEHCLGISQSDLGGMVDGVSAWLDEPADIPRVSKNEAPKGQRAGRVHRLKGLGNAIVPAVAFEILKVIRQLIS